jgi:PAS domain S-box-containing protein
MTDSITGSAVGYRDDAVIAMLLQGRETHVAGRDPRAERAALAGLAQHLADDPEQLLQRVAEAVCELCAADSVVIAVREAGTAGEEVCWNAVAGGLAGHAGKRWPLRACPCGASVLADGAVLFAQPETEFESIRASGVRASEALGVPWRVRGHTAGALVAMLDGDGQHFDAYDLQLLRELAGFAAAAHLGRDALRGAAVESRETALIDATLSISTVGVVYFDLDGSVRDVNRAYEHMTGYTAAELRQPDSWKPITAPEFWALTLRSGHELRETGVTRPYTKQMVRKDGSRWWGLFAPARISGVGHQARCVCFILDVSELKEAEARLAESEQRFHALADGSPALIYQFDPDGELMYLNQRGADDGPADMQAYLRDVCDGIRLRAAAIQRNRVAARDGSWRWFESHAAPWYSDDGVHRGYVGISLDITGAVQAEEALKDADRRKDEFLATLAHELRNPLAPISNAVQLMRRPDGRRQSDRVVEMVGRQVRQIVRLVDDLMEVSRITRGKIDLRLERVPVAEIIHSAVETSQLAIDRAGHRLTVTLPEEPLVLMADRGRLTQVFANLLNNSAKYTDAGGRIRVDVWRDDGHMLASVRDTGIGIPAEALARVFDMFAQAHRAVGRGQGGLGIGLTMVRSLVEMHHGTVEARSAGSGLGSEFVVRLPLAPRQDGWTEQAGAPDARPHAAFAGQRILVVDDNEDAADTLALLLEGDGAEVRVAYDGRAALAAAESFLPSSVLLDIAMPGMDGWEVARRLRQDERHTGLRIIALTGWGQDSDRRQTRNRGFSHHLTKPVSLEDLHQLLI